MRETVHCYRGQQGPNAASRLTSVPRVRRSFPPGFRSRSRARQIGQTRRDAGCAQQAPTDRPSHQWTAAENVHFLAGRGGRAGQQNGAHLMGIAGQGRHLSGAFARGLLPLSKWKRAGVHECLSPCRAKAGGAFTLKSAPRKSAVNVSRPYLRSCRAHDLTVFAIEQIALADEKRLRDARRSRRGCCRDRARQFQAQ